MLDEWPDWHKQKIALCAGQVFRFAFEMQKGDRVLTYDPSRRVYLVGTIEGDYDFSDDLVGDLSNVRRVKWDDEVSRDLLSVSSKNVLGAISTLFTLTGEAAEDVENALAGTPGPESTDQTAQTTEEEDLLKDIQARALEFVKDRVNRLDWDDAQELVAGLLRAMGYKTQISPSGPDRGKDIVASPDGFGFESPRIVVEVKHQRQTMGSQDIRCFLGGRHKDDKGLYVSTGGFTKDARYEAERASIPIMLMDVNDLVAALVEHYEDMDADTKGLLRLTKVYWPA
jgi:restriction system protein